MQALGYWRTEPDNTNMFFQILACYITKRASLGGGDFFKKKVFNKTGTTGVF